MIRHIETIKCLKPHPETVEQVSYTIYRLFEEYLEHSSWPRSRHLPLLMRNLFHN